MPNLGNMVNMTNMMHNQTILPIQNPLFYNFPNYQYFQMLQNKAIFQNNENINYDNQNDKKSIKSLDKSRDVSVDKSVSTIKSRKSKNN
jgi:hypothetical protein